MQHSSIGASSAYRWMTCPASATIGQALPRKSSAAADEGTAAHALAEWCLQNGISPFTRIGDSIRVESKEFIINEEMASGVDMYTSYIWEQAHNKDFHPIAIETQFNLDWLFKGMYGTNDCSAKGIDNGRVLVFDLKYGVSPVYAKENPQMMYYALGILGDQLEGTWYKDIELTIVQPRCEMVGIDTWTISTKDLYTWAYDVLLPAANAASSPNPKFCLGEHCKYCSGLAVCPEINYELETVTGVNLSLPIKEENIVLSDPRHLTPIQKSRILVLSKLMNPWLKAIEESAFEDAMQGRLLEGWKLVQKRAGNRKWSDENDVIQTFKPILGEDIYKERELKSPAQLEKLLSKKEIEGFTHRLPSGLELARETDKRKAINPQQDILDGFEE